MCVSYRKHNGIAKPSEFPIPSCDDAISTIGSGLNKILIISLDAIQGYHQISVCCVNREILSLFAPSNQKYMFLVMTFGTTTAPGLYSDMINNLKDEWYVLFIETHRKIGILINE